MSIQPNESDLASNSAISPVIYTTAGTDSGSPPFMAERCA